MAAAQLDPPYNPLPLEPIPDGALEKCDRTINKGDVHDPLSKKVFDDGIYGTISVWTMTVNVHTCMCHHFTPDLRHCVANGLGPEAAMKCKGVFYGKITSPNTLYCAEARTGGGHHPCNAQKCPWIKAGKPCPYSEPNSVDGARIVFRDEIPHLEDMTRSSPGSRKGMTCPSN